jgi:hypothetical protein
MTTAVILTAIASLASAGSAIIAAMALIYTARQGRKSAQISARQEITRYSLEFLNLVISTPGLQYLGIGEGGESGRDQQLFERMLANVVYSIWDHLREGNFDNTCSPAYDSLIRMIVAAHPGVMGILASGSYPSGVHSYVVSIIATDAQSDTGFISSPESPLGTAKSLITLSAAPFRAIVSRWRRVIVKEA